MAFSANQNQVQRHSCSLLDAGEEAFSLPVRAMLLWSRLNLMAAEFGETRMGDRYLRITFEDLCHRPQSTIRQVYDFLDLRGDIPRVSAEEVMPPASLGGWRGQSPGLIAELEGLGARALRHLGYIAAP
jgi:hypothetical protein